MIAMSEIIVAIFFYKIGNLQTLNLTFQLAYAKRNQIAKFWTSTFKLIVPSKLHQRCLVVEHISKRNHSHACKVKILWSQPEAVRLRLLYICCCKSTVNAVLGLSVQMNLYADTLFSKGICDSSAKFIIYDTDIYPPPSPRPTPISCKDAA